MKRPLLHCALLALAASSPFSADCAEPAADQGARQWLEKMIEATQSLNYEGTFIYIQGPHVEAMRIVHGGGGQDEDRQRLVSLTGPPREILATKEGVVCLQPDTRATPPSGEHRYARFPINVPREIGRLESQYDFTLEGQDRAAGVEVQVVAIKPRDALRYGYRLWLDRRNGMLLRSALLDERGEPIEQLMFTDMQIKDRIDETVFKSPIPTERVESPPADRPDAEASSPQGMPIGLSPWSVARLPDGFAKILHNRFTEASGRHPIEHMVFADGLATVSVFVERLDGAAPLLQGDSRRGSMNAFGTRLDDYQILVVGEVPAETVRQIAASISYDHDAAKKLAEESKP